MTMNASCRMGTISTRDTEAAMRGDFANAGMAITYYSIADPGCAPEGGSILNLFFARRLGLGQSMGQAATSKIQREPAVQRTQNRRC